MSDFTKIFKGIQQEGLYILDTCPYCEEKYSFRFMGDFYMYECVACKKTGTMQEFRIEMADDLIYGRLMDSVNMPKAPEGMIDIASYVPNKSSSIVIPSGFSILDRMTGGFRGGELTILTGKRAEGKCLQKGTQVVMYTGEFKKVEDIVVGDKLMGVDSTPRTVLSLDSGIEELFAVHQMHGDTYAVTKNHVLCLNERRTRKDIEITVSDYIKQSKTWKLFTKGYAVGIELPERDVAIDPYFLGLWLGDGTAASVAITTPDIEVAEHIYRYAESHGQKVTVQKETEKAHSYYITSGVGKHKANGSDVLNEFQNYGLLFNKHIPDDYLYNSRAVRLELLAGIVDADGYLNNHSYEIVQKNKRLAEQIQYLANSLGLRCRFVECQKTCCNNGKTGTYYRANIYGDTGIIPVKVERRKRAGKEPSGNPTYSVLDIKSCGEGEYYGFEIDGDHKFLLSDFTVTHNSTWAGQIALNAVDSGHKVFFYSGELSAQAFQNWLFMQAAGEDYLNSYEDQFGQVRYEIEHEYAEPHIRNWLMGKMILYDNTIIKSGEANTILDRARTARNHYGCDMIFVDNLKTAKFKKDTERDHLRKQANFVVDMLGLAKELNVHVVVVAHPKKEDTGDSNDNVSGLSDITDIADNVIGISRVKEEAKLKHNLDYDSVLELSKNRAHGMFLGKMKMNFDVKSRRFILQNSNNISRYGWESEI